MARRPPLERTMNSESFDSQDTKNEDPVFGPRIGVVRETETGVDQPADQPPPWVFDDDMTDTIDELVQPGIREGWLRYGIMWCTFGLKFDDAVDECFNYISARADSFSAFYIGITCKPSDRWGNDEFGHSMKYQGMDLLYVHPKSKKSVVGSAGAMETELIARCRARLWEAFQNVGKGGERPPKSSPCFVYLAWLT